MRGRSGIRNQELGIRYRGHLPDGLSYRAAPDSSRLILLMSEYATRTERLERYLSLAVGVAVIGAMLVSLYQANLARAQLRASAWPYLSQSNSWEGGTYHFVTVNEGIGPAKVKSFRVLVDGHSVPTWNAAMRALTGEGEPALTYGSFGHGTVLPAQRRPCGEVLERRTEADADDRLLLLRVRRVLAVGQRGAGAGAGAVVRGGCRGGIPAVARASGLTLHERGLPSCSLTRGGAAW
jgi:hypothetical protein